MEFYLRIFDLFCHPRDIVYRVFSGTKILYVGLVSCSSFIVSSPPQPYFTFCTLKCKLPRVKLT